MPAAQQNALVGKYCATCHDNKKRLGGLTLETFDAARPDPAIASMMVNKLDGGAMGAAGLAQPDKTTVTALRSALAAAARNTEAATGGWTLLAFNDRLRALSPKLVLERGYALVRSPDGTFVRSADKLKTGDTVTLEFATGEADATVTTTRRGGSDG